LEIADRKLSLCLALGSVVEVIDWIRYMREKKGDGAKMKGRTCESEKGDV